MKIMIIIIIKNDNDNDNDTITITITIVITITIIIMIPWQTPPSFHSDVLQLNVGCSKSKIILIYNQDVNKKYRVTQRFY